MNCTLMLKESVNPGEQEERKCAYLGAQYLQSWSDLTVSLLYVHSFVWAIHSTLHSFLRLIDTDIRALLLVSQ